MRLDEYLVQHNYGTRSRVKLLIEAGAVLVNAVVTKKASKTVTDADSITVTDIIPYVSRAGLKLDFTLKHFAIDPAEMTCLDIGSSTGGFTDCLLQYGARSVDAVDVGTDQFAQKLRNDIRVRLFEKTDIRDYKADTTYDMVVCDVSFISLTKIIPEIPRFCHSGTHILLLIKPQFEVGKERLGKGGIVTNPEYAEQVILDILDCAHRYGLIKTTQHVACNIKGGDGNQEYCAHFTYVGKSV